MKLYFILAGILFAATTIKAQDKSVDPLSINMEVRVALVSGIDGIEKQMKSDPSAAELAKLKLVKEEFEKALKEIDKTIEQQMQSEKPLKRWEFIYI